MNKIYKTICYGLSAVLGFAGGCLYEQEMVVKPIEQRLRSKEAQVRSVQNNLRRYSFGIRHNKEYTIGLDGLPRLVGPDGEFRISIDDLCKKVEVKK